MPPGSIVASLIQPASFAFKHNMMRVTDKRMRLKLIVIEFVVFRSGTTLSVGQALSIVYILPVSFVQGNF